jgi:DNA mismatch endonuclease (patch repair protein)
VTDHITKKHRSWNMSRIRSRGTKPELAVRSALKRLGLHFRGHVKRLPGSPDILLPGQRTVIFVHGCFWHRHKNCKFAYSPKSNLDFWERKFRSNVDRDRRIRRKLRELGWTVRIVWECQTRKASCLDKLLRRVSSIQPSEAV